MHNIVFNSNPAESQGVGVFDWLVSYAVCDWSDLKLSVDAPNTSQLETRENLREFELVIHEV